nr:MAG TPA: hypothetical protein [Caudoviricetes sp.]
MPISINLTILLFLPCSGRNRHFIISECLYALFYGIITTL